MPARSSFPSASPPHGLFWPNLILILALNTFMIYQIGSLKYQLTKVTQAIEQVEGPFERAQHAKAEFLSLAKDVLRLAPKDPNAQQIVTAFKLQQFKAAHENTSEEPASAPHSAWEQKSATASTNIAPVVPPRP